ncbi:MAG: hypothetical protein AB8F94_27455 [Saprospiraceae bacterium]
MKNRNLRFIAQLALTVFGILFSFSTVSASAIFTNGSCLQAHTIALETGNLNSLPPATKNINRAVKAFLTGPTVKGLNVLGYKWNFWKTVKVSTKRTSSRILLYRTTVTGRFSYDRKWKSNHKFFFTATIIHGPNSKSRVEKITYRIQKNASWSKYYKYITSTANAGITYFTGTDILKIKDNHLNYFLEKTYDKVKKDKRGKTSWVDAAKQISVMLAISAAKK